MNIKMFDDWCALQATIRPDGNQVIVGSKFKDTWAFVNVKNHNGTLISHRFFPDRREVVVFDKDGKEVKYFVENYKK